MREVRAEGSPLNRQVLLPAERFIYSETISGALLLVCAIVALAWANSPWSQSYFALRDTPVSFQIGTSMTVSGLPFSSKRAGMDSSTSLSRAGQSFPERGDCLRSS